MILFLREESADPDTQDSLPNPDVMMLISPQCDLECRPENFDRNVVLIGGTFIPFQDRANHRDATITDLFVHQDNHYSIVWEPQERRNCRLPRVRILAEPTWIST